MSALRQYQWWFQFELHGLPELDLFPDKHAQDDAITACVARPRYTRWLFWLGVLLGPPVLIVLPQLLVGGFAAFLPSVPWYLKLGTSLFVNAAFVYVTSISMRSDAARFLRGRLLQCGVPVCMECGYCLRGLVSVRCPECGRAIDERVAKLIADAA